MSTNKFQSKITEMWLRAIRLYTFNAPIDKGKHRVYLLGLKLCKNLPTNSEVVTKDGRKFSVDLNTGMNNTVFFLGEYEKTITDIIKPLIKKGDVCLDIGANFGWYTTLFHKYAGDTGQVHSFEPMKPSFNALKKNYELMDKSQNVHINNLAIGDKLAELDMYLFPDLPTGHASISKHDIDNFVSYKCQMVTLDHYIEKENVADVNFVKVDIEGSELMFLKGAEKLFQQKVPPIFLVEMALKQTKSFGYLPDDLLKFINSRADYDFYKIDEINSKLIKIKDFAKDDIGANVICFPCNYYRDRFEFLKRYID